MKLYLIASLLLLVPLVLAQQPRFGKLIYSGGYLLSSLNQSGLSRSSDTKFTFQKYDLHFDFSLSTSVWERARNMQISPKGERSSFVIEWIDGPAPRMGKMQEFCKRNSSPELRPLIMKCAGLVRLRALSAKETSQIEAFKNEGTGSSMAVLYDRKNLVSKAAKLHFFEIESSYGKKMWIKARHGGASSLTVNLVNHKNKPFLVNGPVGESGCDRPSASELYVRYCSGEVKISILPDPGNEADEEDEENEEADEVDNGEEENKKAKPSLDDLSPEELKNLLKDILDRL